LYTAHEKHRHSALQLSVTKHMHFMRVWHTCKYWQMIHNYIQL